MVNKTISKSPVPQNNNLPSDRISQNSFEIHRPCKQKNWCMVFPSISPFSCSLTSWEPLVLCTKCKGYSWMHRKRYSFPTGTKANRNRHYPVGIREYLTDGAFLAEFSEVVGSTFGSVPGSGHQVQNGSPEGESREDEEEEGEEVTEIRFVPVDRSACKHCWFLHCCREVTCLYVVCLCVCGGHTTFNLITHGWLLQLKQPMGYWQQPVGY